MITGITLTVTIIAALVSFFVITPQYQSSTKLFIGKEEGNVENYNSSDITMYQNLLGTYSQAIQTKDLVEKAISNSGYSYKAGEVKNNLTVNTVTGTQIMEVSFKNESPIVAQKILSVLTDEFMILTRELVANGNVKVLETAQIAENPISPNKKMNIAIAFVLGIMISFGIVFLMEYLDNTYKTKEQLEKDLGIPVFGVIPEADLE